MSPRIIALATKVGGLRNQFGVLVEPGLDELKMGIDVARRAIGQLPDGMREIDRVIFASSGIRPIFPSGAIAIASRLDLHCTAFDVVAACASMSIAVEIAASAEGRSLIVSADMMSATIDPDDPSHQPLRNFSDGAAALVIGDGTSMGVEIVANCGLIDGRWREYYGASAGKMLRTLPSSSKTVLRESYLNSWVEIAQTLLRRRKRDGTLWIYANQGEQRLFPELTAALGLRSEQLIVTDHGHAGGADPWIGLDARPISRGESAILLASGIGFAFHGTLIEYL